MSSLLRNVLESKDQVIEENKRLQETEQAIASALKECLLEIDRLTRENEMLRDLCNQSVHCVEEYYWHLLPRDYPEFLKKLKEIKGLS